MRSGYYCYCLETQKQLLKNKLDLSHRVFAVNSLLILGIYIKSREVVCMMNESKKPPNLQNGKFKWPGLFKFIAEHLFIHRLSCKKPRELEPPTSANSLLLSER